MTFKRILAGLLALALVLGMIPATAPAVSAAEADETYTYNKSTTNMPAKWNPHTWETTYEEEFVKYLQTPLAELTVKDSATGEYQVVFMAATGIADVTAAHQDDLVKYGCAETEATEGYVYEIALRPELTWEDGTPITADTYIYSMKALLDSQMQNLRASMFTEGDGALAGAYEFSYQGVDMELQCPDWNDLVKSEDGTYTTTSGGKVWIATETPLDWLGGYTMDFYVNYFGSDYFGMDDYAALRELADENGNIPLTDESLELLVGAITAVAAWGESAEHANNYMLYELSMPACEYDSTVGLYKVDDYTIRYVCETPVSSARFLEIICSNWLVYQPIYESCIVNTTVPYGSTYCTDKNSTMSYGPYRLESYSESEAVFTRNENYFEYDVDANGNITSTTSFLVDGEYVPQWQSDRIVITALDSESAHASFLAGELDAWDTAGHTYEYATSQRLYKAKQSYLTRLFFNCSLEALQNMDANYGNVNSVVLSNDSFRKAFSLAIDRSAYVSATPGYTPEIGLINSLYYYDAYNDPASVYRNSEQAKRAMCELYGVEYTEENYNALTGYDLEQARELMTKACDELMAAGLYTKGEPIVIRAAWSLYDLTDDQRKVLDYLNCAINAAAEGSGFGKIVLQPASGNRYYAVPNGEFAIGYGAWGSGVFFPFNVIGCYTDASYADIHEGGSWDPEVTYLTLTVNGKEETMSYADWSRSIRDAGEYSNADFDTKLTILSGLEKGILEKYYCIPLASMASGVLMSYQVDYYTDNYNSFYGFGGQRLLRYHYSDQEWEAYLAENELDYSGPVCDYEFDYSVEIEEEEKLLASGTCGDNLTWTLTEDGVLTISGTGDMDDYVYVDDTRAPWDAYSSNIQSVVIENGVTSIGEHAFFECCKLVSVTIPGSVTDIGMYAFAYCVNLTNAIISDGVAIIGPGAFHGCESLVSIDIPDTVTSIENCAFAYCVQLTSVTIPGSVTSIGNCAFEGCGSLVEVIFQGDAPSIGMDAFVEVIATVYYPADNETWTADVMQNYGGEITWVAYEVPNCDDGHSYEAVVTEPTCTEDGYTTYTCSVCGDSYVSDYVWATGCDPWIILSMPTFYGPGEAYKNCSKCGETAYKELPQKQNYAPLTNLPASFRNALGLLDWFHDLDQYYMIQETNDYFLAGFDYWDSVTVSASDYEAVLHMYFIVDDAMLETIRQESDDGEWSWFYYDEEEQTYTIRNIGGIGGSLPPREMIGYVQNGDTYEVYYAQIIYAYLQDALPEDVDEWEYAEELGWPAFIEYDGIVYESGPDGYAAVTGLRNYGKKYTVDIQGEVVRIHSVEDYSEEDLPEHLHYHDRAVIDATCSAYGYTEYTCVCGDSYKAEYTDKLEHVYENGFCVNCGLEYGIVAAGTCGENLTWKLNDKGVLTISGTGPMDDFDNPEGIGGITPWRDYQENITAVVIEAGVTYIGIKAFADCWNVTEVTLSETITAIGKDAFLLTNMETILLPAGLESLGSGAFGGCFSLREVYFQGDAPVIDDNAFSSTTATAYYPAGNETWTEEVMQNYGGEITWVAYEPEEVDYELPEDGSVTIPENDCFEPDTVVKVEKVEEGEIFESAAAVMETVAQQYVVFEITATKDNVSVQPDGGLTVVFAIPEGYSNNLQIFCLTEDGTLEPIEATVDPETRTIVVVLPHFSTYILVDMDSEPAVRMGDVNGDGKVNTTDAKLIMQYELGIIGQEDLNLAAADVNGDGKVNTTDAKLVMQLELGIIKEFPKP